MYTRTYVVLFQFLLYKTSHISKYQSLLSACNISYGNFLLFKICIGEEMFPVCLAMGFLNTVEQRSDNDVNIFIACLQQEVQNQPVRRITVEECVGGKGVNCRLISSSRDMTKKEREILLNTVRKS